MIIEKVGQYQHNFHSYLVKKFFKLMLNGYLGVTTFKRGQPSYMKDTLSN